MSNPKDRNAPRVAPEAWELFKSRSSHEPLSYTIDTKGHEFESAELTADELDFLELLVAQTPSRETFEPQQCYHNSQIILLHNSPTIRQNKGKFDLDYYEGYALSDEWLIPINHGWLSLNGKVVDLTLTDQDTQNTDIPKIVGRIIGKIPQHMVYIGIPIEMDDVLERIQIDGQTHTILDDYRSETSTLRSKYIPSKGEWRQIRKSLRSNGETDDPCKAKMRELKRELTFDFEYQKAALEDALDFIRGSKKHQEGYAEFSDVPLSEVLESVECLIQIAEDSEHLEDQRAYLEEASRLLAESVVLQHTLPPYYGVEVEGFIPRPFWFIHFTEEDKLALITEEGFEGRAESFAILSSKLGREAAMSKQGYVFAYVVDDLQDQESAIEAAQRTIQQHLENWYYFCGDRELKPYKCASLHAVIGKADMGVAVFNKIDSESQVIIPASCIHHTTLVSSSDVVTRFWGKSY